jgi:N-acetylmuramoyl-L-alanine amidase
MSGRLAIVVGHDSRAQGAASVAPLSMSEYRYNVLVAAQMVAMSSTMSVESKIFLRDGIGLIKCYKQVETWKPDAVIELHFNSCNAPNVLGTETLVGEDDDSCLFGQFIHASVCHVFGRRQDDKTDRGLKTIANTPGERAWYNVNSLPMIPNVLTEPFFGSNKADAKRGLDLMKPYADALVRAFDTWYKCRETGDLVTMLKVN